MKETARRSAISASHTLVRSVAFWVSVALLVFVPLAFSTAVYRIFSLPRFLILLTGSAVLLPLIGLIAVDAARNALGKFVSKHVLLVSAYIAVVVVSTIFGAAPVGSLFGSFENQMGLITRLCFYSCFVGIIFGIGQSWTRLTQMLWAMAFTGLCVATYAFAQFFGRDLFLPASLYTFTSIGETIVRPIGTLGHANYLGNFLLYTTPLSLALALNSSGTIRRLGIVASAVSTAAIAFSGTRGAWVGLMVGGVVFLVLELPKKSELRAILRRRALVVALAGSLILLSALLVASRPASRSVFVRARSFVTEGFTGAGRTLLWRDVLAMVPAFPVVGCAPDGFRLAFLPYRSKQLASLAPETNNESSHNSYLDAAVLFGLPGAVLYAAMIVSTFSLLIRARRQMDRRRRVIITGLLASFAAVTAHNFFIFDQISTGLYFFAFLALGSVTRNVAESETLDAADGDERRASEFSKRRVAGAATSASGNKNDVFVVALSGVVLVALGWYSMLALNADKHVNQAFLAAQQGNLDQVMRSAEGATRSWDPTGQRDFIVARALTLYGERVRTFQDSGTRRTSDETSVEARATALNLATMYATKSLARTLEPNSNNLLLAYLAFLRGDASKLREHATEAVKLDPYFANARWLMAEAYLAEGDREQAAREARIALEINPTLPQARSALKRAQGDTLSARSVDKSLERARQLLSAGNIFKAETVLLRSLRSSSGPCAECHRLLAIAYEQSNLFDDAILEWQSFLREAPDRANAEQTPLRIEKLKQQRSGR